MVYAITYFYNLYYIYNSKTADIIYSNFDDKQGLYNKSVVMKEISKLINKSVVI